MCGTAPHPSAFGCHLPLKGKAFFMSRLSVSKPSPDKNNNKTSKKTGTGFLL
jgi:hypothetical protein